MSDNSDYLSSRVRGHRCTFCAQEILDPPPQFPWAWRVWLHRDYVGAIEAAESGCSFYAWLVSQVNASGDSRRDQTFEMIFRSPTGSAADVNILEVRIWTGNYAWPAQIFDVVVDFDDPAASMSISRIIDGDVASAASREQMRKWLHDCNSTTHPMCFKEQDGAIVLPTRVLGISIGEQCDMIRLKEVQPSMRSIEYAALSYCWGDNTQLRTTLDNIAAHKSGISVSALPQTIQDAIEIARFLDLPYLWVDSLCIIQDSPDDWTKNCANMQYYYSNSTLTIVAGSATRSAEGFLRPETIWQSDGFYLPMRMPGGGLGAVKLKARNRTGEPIDARAWTLQEQLLPKRTLHFGSHTVNWKCPQVQYGVRASMDMITKSRKSGFKHRFLWQSLVAEYTLRKMSNLDDCLPAISGLASWLVLEHNKSCTDQRCYEKHSDYAAGLWLKETTLVKDSRPELFDNIVQLLWYSRDSCGKRPARYRAPSWSWAAVDGPISFPVLVIDEASDYLEISRTQARLAACETQLASMEAPFGRVTGGYISVKCRLRRWPTTSEHRATARQLQSQDEWGDSTVADPIYDKLLFDSVIAPRAADERQSMPDWLTPASWEDWEEGSQSSPQQCPNPVVLGNAFGIKYIADTEADINTITAAHFGQAQVWCLEILSRAHKTGEPRGLLVMRDEERDIIRRIGVYCMLVVDDEGHWEAASFFDDIEMEEITIH